MMPTQRILVDYMTPLADVSQLEVGGKGWNLFRLRDAGIPVPRWCVITTQVFEDVVNVDRPRIQEALDGIDYTRQSSIEHASSMIDFIIREAALTARLTHQAEAAIRQWKQADCPLAVRSSAVGEDGAADSFAGLFSSSLNVVPADVMEHVLRVWSSAFSPRSLVYRHRKQLPLSGIRTAVILQELVPAVKSGILFTADPDTGERTAVISAGYGLGEGIVANKVETDTYRIYPNGHGVKATVVRKSAAVVPGRRNGDGTSLANVGFLKGRLRVLNNGQIRELRDLGSAIEMRLGCAQDIEWAYDRSGRPFILQSRPIVFSAASRKKETIRVWDNSNIVESYPGITLPLTFSFISDAYERIFRRATFGFVRKKDRHRIDSTIFASMVGLIRGRVYYNLLNWYKLLSYLPGFQRHKPAWDRMIGIKHKIDFPSTPLTFASRLKAFCRAADILLLVDHRATRFDAWFADIYRNHSATQVGNLTVDEAISRIRALVTDLESNWHQTLYNDLAAMKYFDWLTRLSQRWIGESHPNIHNDLLCGQDGMESVRPLHSILEIVRAVLKHPRGRDLLTTRDDRQAWHMLQSEKDFSRIRLLIERHIDRFGDRGLEELKLESQTFREDPPSLLALIRQYSLEKPVAGPHDRDIRVGAEAAVREALHTPIRRLVFAFVLRNTRKAITARENMRFARSRTYGIARRLFKRIGEVLAADGVLERSPDVFYLTVQEVIGCAEGTSPCGPLRQIVEARKQHYVTYADAPPDRIVTEGIPDLHRMDAQPVLAGTPARLQGTGCSSGKVRGPARVVRNPREFENNSGRILVARSTDPGWVFLMLTSLGIIVERGSVLSHTAIIGRELGIPTIIGVSGATSIVRDGGVIEMDGGAGEIRWD